MAGRAFERFTGDGPLALLPIADNRAAFIWTLAPTLAEKVLGYDDDEFIDAIQSAFGSRVGRFSKVGKRVAYPLFLSKANGVVSRRSVLVGNAAHGLHPVAAQGFNLGLRDVAALCDCIAERPEAWLGRDVAARFETLHAMGVQRIIVAMPFGLEERYTIIETLAREVMPRVSAGSV